MVPRFISPSCFIMLDNFRFFRIFRGSSFHLAQNSTLNTQHSTLNTQHSTLNTQHSTLNTQHSTLNTQHSPFSIQHSAAGAPLLCFSVVPPTPSTQAATTFWPLDHWLMTHDGAAGPPVSSSRTSAVLISTHSPH
ncbi:hypothetical protein [Rubritalea tangerina]|uniref:hypothetical protein n=1 Tax=Rubritalea tangerina TaxID=430798 RepID=UPI003621FFDA